MQFGRTGRSRAYSAMNATKSIAVVYEDAEARKTAVDFCDTLVSRFWDQFEFEVSWWSFSSLESEISAKAAARKAIVADFVVFATRFEKGVPRHLKSWIEMWLS